MKKLCKFILWAIGWKVETEVPDIKKCIVLGAPHTSNSDFYLSMIFFLSRGMKISFLIKKEALFFPFKKLILKLGGIPVDRGKKNNLIDQLTDIFEKQEELMLMIAPEGTRKEVK